MISRKKLSLTELNRLDELQFKALKKKDIVIVADNIRSAMNVGALFRTSDSFAIKKLILTGISSTPPHKEINKTAIGATTSVDWKYYNTTKEALSELKKNGYTIVAVEQTSDAVFLKDYSIETSKKYALVLGNEVQGVSDDTVEMADTCIEIEQFGTKHSLNVAVCAGIVIWHFCKEM